MNMDDLIVKYLLGSADAGETTRVERWLAADERNRERLRQFRTLWDLSGRTAVSVRPDTQEALGRLRQRLGRVGGSRKGMKVRRESGEWGEGNRAGGRIGEPGDAVGVRREMGRVMLRRGLVAAALVGLMCIGVVIFIAVRRNNGAAGAEGTARRGAGATAKGGETGKVTAGGEGTAIVGVTVTIPGKDK